MGKPVKRGTSGEYYTVREKIGFMLLLSYSRITADHFARGEIDQVQFGEIAPIIRELWDDGAVKRVFDQRHLFQIVSTYYYQNLGFKFKNSVIN